jgi:putative membrane protein
MRHVLFVPCLCLALGVALAAAPARPTATRQHTASAQVSGPQATFLKNVAQDNMAEIDMAALAESKSTRDDVKALAQRIRQDHIKAQQDLSKLAESTKVTLPTEVSAKQRAEADHLKSLNGAAFDRAYIDQMVVAHTNAVHTFQNNENDKNPDVAAFAKDTLPVLQGHLQQAQKIQSTMKSGA